MTRSTWIALLIALAVVLWLASGLLRAPTTDVGAAITTTPAATAVTRVRVREMTVEPVSREVVVHGHTAPARTATLRAETAGRVEALGATRGSRVAAGDLLVQLAADARPARLREAEALVAQRELEYRGAQSLKDKGLNAETHLAAARAQLESARAALAAIRTDLERTRIEAPFRGTLQERLVEVGDSLGVNDPVATVVELDPLIVTGEVSELEVDLLRAGLPGTAKLVSGQTLSGEVRYLSPEADAATRTFTVELEVANPERAPAGVTAELHIPVAEVAAHRISPALLTLDDAGVIGVKTVTDDGVVQFHPVELVRSSAESLWVRGLPEHARVITVGQGFVRAGDRVEAVAE